VVNFRSETMIDVGFMLLLGAATILTAGPTVVKFGIESWQNTDNRNPAGAERQVSHSGR